MSTWTTLQNWTLSEATNNHTTVYVSSYAVLLYKISLTLWMIIPPILVVLGTFGNVMIVMVMRRMRDSQSTAGLSAYFTALAISDECQLISQVCYQWVDLIFGWPPSFFSFSLLCIVPKFVRNVSSNVSAWLLVAMTFQRMTSVVVPHRVATLCTEKRGHVIIAVIVMISCGLNVQVLFTYFYHRNYNKCLVLEKFRDGNDMSGWFVLFYTSVIPFLLLIIGSSIIIAHVIKSVQFSRTLKVNQEQQASTNKVYSITRTLLLTSFAFLVQCVPWHIFNLYRQQFGVIIDDPDFNGVINVVGTLIMHLWYSVAAFNFYLYILSGSKFRQEASRYLCCRLKGKKLGKIKP